MLTFASCENLLNNRETKKLAGNTYLRKNGDQFIIRFYDTDIVKVLPDDSLILSSGGYNTKTTKNRINEYIGNKLYQKNSIWFINDIPFYDGIMLDKSGNLINAIDNTGNILEDKKKLDRMVKEYINGYAKWALENGVERSNGDCWHCLFSMGDNLDHVYSHLKEQYYFGSFLDYVIKQTGRAPLRRIFIEKDLTRGDTTDLRGILGSYFRKNKAALLKYVREQ